MGYIFRSPHPGPLPLVLLSHPMSSDGRGVCKFLSCTRRRGRRSRSRTYVFSVAAGVLPVSLNISHAGAAGTKRSAPVLGRSNARQRRESGKSQAPEPADVAAAETAALRIIRRAQGTLNTYRTPVRHGAPLRPSRPPAEPKLGAPFCTRPKRSVEEGASSA